jgi:pyroglutamyl-peptidase
MSAKPRIVITGFGPFPGAPYNPTEPLVARLMHLRRPLFDDVARIGHIFPVSYSAVDRDLPMLIAAHRPHALLMFGLAARTPHLRIETRARNVVTQLWPDAEHANVNSRSIARDAPFARSFSPHTEKFLRAARATGIDACPSLSAGSYLCNYLSWRAIEATDRAEGPRLAAFIHVPLVPRDAAYRQTAAIGFEQLVDAGEALLAETVRQVRPTAEM